MAWSMPPTGPWNPGVMPDMNTGSFTQEQWTAMQQQNWQQWAQWQQQYAHWHNQYGGKYAEQMQTYQAMSGMPPLPPANSAPAPPAPPPPEQPPPPPHENNQPLYGSTQNPPPPVPAPLPNEQKTNASNPNNITPVPNNNSTWSYDAGYAAETQNELSQSGNADALSKLAEEEKQFDIQFQKWEEEIEKWKRENVNHPDKQAYKEYEEKFEACRAQLLERRQQMNQKRAHLMGNINIKAGNTATSNIIPSAVPPPLIPNLPSNYNNMHKQSNDPNQNNIQINRQNQNNQNIRQNQNSQNIRQNQNNLNMRQNQNNQNIRQNQNNQNIRENQNNQNIRENQNNQNIRQNQNNLMQVSNNKQIQNSSNRQMHNYSEHSMQTKQYSHTMPAYNRKINKNVDPQDRYESYQDISEDYPPNESYSAAYSDNSNFLPTSEPGKSIPGLDLVPDTDKALGANKTQEIIDITEEKSHTQQLAPPGPDYSTISQGINNILGDKKIMNILSMMRGSQVMTNNQNENIPSQTNMGHNLNIPPPHNMVDANQNNQQYSNTQNMPYNRQGHDYGFQQNQEFNSNFPSQNTVYDDQRNDIHHEQYYDPNTQYDNMPQAYKNETQRSGPAIKPLMSAQRHPLQDISGQQIIDSRSAIRAPIPGNNISSLNEPVKQKWVEEPMFTPSIVVDYDHKPLRLKARDFIEPFHMFDYNHKSKDGNPKKKDFEKEAEDLFSRKPRRPEKDDERINYSRYTRDQYSKDYERRLPREDLRDDYRSRQPPRDEYDDRRRLDEKRRDDKYSRRDDYNRDRDRDYYHRDRRDLKRDDRNRSRSREREFRKRALSKDTEISDSSSKRIRDVNSPVVNSPLVNSPAKGSPPKERKFIVMIDDLLEPPGRQLRPEKIVIILRGPPGSGKSYLAKLIRDREAEHGGTVRIMSIDDYFMQEGEEEAKDPTTGKIIKKPTLKYEYDEKAEETYITSLKRAFRRSITDGYFSFLIYDAVNEHLKSYADMWNYARQYSFQVYVCTMELDPQTCFKRNIHNRTLEQIETICGRFFPTPSHHIQLDATTLLQSAAITEVQMEDVEDKVVTEEAQEAEVENSFTSKWEKMDDAAQLARLDGTSKPLRPSQLSMEDYLQLDEWKPNTAKPGKKTVRWADIEESREQEKMRAIGFVVGQTDWNRMTDPTMGSSALTQTKYIERVRRN